MRGAWLTGRAVLTPGQDRGPGIRAGPGSKRQSKPDRRKPGTDENARGSEIVTRSETERGSEPGAGSETASGSEIGTEREPGTGNVAASGSEIGTASEPGTEAESAARAICLRMLTSGPRTRAQLAAGLARRGVSEDVAERLLARFEEVGLIDDAAFAAAWVESRHVGRGMGRRALAHDLRSRGVEDRLVDEAVAGLSRERELTMARQLVAKRLPATRGLDTHIRVRRLAGMLARRGYPSGVALSVVREALEADGVESASLAGLNLDDAEPEEGS